MNRRQVILGLGAVASGAAAASGTGAFSSTRANRRVTVAVENDREAHLALTPTASDFSTMSSQSVIEFAFDGDVSSPGGTNEDTGEGVAPNSVYEFQNLFKVENNGPDALVIFGRGTTDQGVKTQIVTEGRKRPLTKSNPSDVILTPGGSQRFGLKLTIGDISPQEIDTEVGIVAAGKDSEQYPEAFPE